MELRSTALISHFQLRYPTPHHQSARQDDGGFTRRNLERYVVVGDALVADVVTAAGRAGGLRGARGLATGRSSAWGEVAASAASTVAAAEQHQTEIISNDFGAIALLAALIFPVACLKAPLDVDLTTFRQVLSYLFGTPYDDVVPIGTFLPFAGLSVLNAIGSGDTKIGDGCTAGRVARLGVFA